MGLGNGDSDAAAASKKSLECEDEREPKVRADGARMGLPLRRRVDDTEDASVAPTI